MPLLLRKIRRGRWLEPINRHGQDEPSSDTLDDLRSTGGTISVWEVDDELHNLELVAIALALSAERIANFDYALCGLAELRELEINTSPDDTPVPTANIFHRNVVKLSAGDLAAVAEAFFRSQRLNRLTESRMKALVKDAVFRGLIDLSAIHGGMRSQIDNL